MILLYHAVEGNQLAKELLRESKVETLPGCNVRVFKSRDRVFFNRSQGIAADVTASNATSTPSSRCCCLRPIDAAGLDLVLKASRNVVGFYQEAEGGMPFPSIFAPAKLLLHSHSVLTKLTRENVSR